MVSGMDKYKVCVAQTTSYKSGKDHNLRRAGKMIKEAAENGAALIAFPEMYLTGYTASHRIYDLCEAADGPSFKVMARYAAECGIHVAYGFPERRAGEVKPDDRAYSETDELPVVYNSMNFISDKGELIGTYAKSHLFAGERIHFTPGNDFKVYDTALGRVGLLVCYDLEFPEPARRLGVRGAEVIIAISANMGPYEDIHEHFARSRAMENGAYLVYSNYTGSDNRFTYVGRSGLYAPDGRLYCGSSERAEELVYADVDLNQARNVPKDIDYLRYISKEERELYLLDSSS